MSEHLTLEALMSQLNLGMTKSAEADETTGEKKEEGKAKDEKPEAASDKTKDVKKELEECSDAYTEQTKEAHLRGQALADEIMQKVASANFTPNQGTTTDMNKQAELAGEALADALLLKFASAGDVTTTDGINPGSAVSKTQADVAQQIFEDNNKVRPTPGTDGLKAGGSVNQIFDAIIADAMAQGAASYDQTHTVGISPVEGAVADHAVPNQVSEESVEESVEKTAALNHLVGLGCDFDSAFALVKQAEAEIQAEEDMQIKQAAIGALIDRGVDFNSAVAMVKEANRVGDAFRSARDFIKDKAESAALHAMYAGDNVAANYRKGGQALRNSTLNLSQDARELWSGRKAGWPEERVSRVQAAKGIAKNPLVYGPAGLAAVGTGGYALAHQKQAAVAGLIDAGLDFDDAVALVANKSQELYGC